MKLTPRVNFINVFTHSFYASRSWKPKKLLELTDFCALLGSACLKAACKMLMKLTPNLQISFDHMFADVNFQATNQILIFVEIFQKFWKRFHRILQHQLHHHGWYFDCQSFNIPGSNPIFSLFFVGCQVTPLEPWAVESCQSLKDYPDLINFINIIGARQVLCRYFLTFLFVIKLREIVFKYGAQNDNCKRKHTIKFQRKCWWIDTAPFLLWAICLCALCQLVGEVNTWLVVMILALSCIFIGFSPNLKFSSNKIPHSYFLVNSIFTTRSGLLLTKLLLFRETFKTHQFQKVKSFHIRFKKLFFRFKMN